MRKRLNFIMIILPLIFLSFLLFILFVKTEDIKPPSVLNPFSYLSPSPNPVTKTRWATDSGILEIEENISKLKNSLNSTILDDTSLFPPSLNFGLEINP